jgi:hypothetical protein
MRWIFLILFGAVGAGAFWYGLTWGIQRYQLVTSGRAASGVIVDHASHQRDGRIDWDSATPEPTTYHPIVEFETAEGERVRIEGTTGNVDSAKAEVGTSVNVVYDPANPSEAVITDFQQAWLGPLALSVFGFVFIVMAVSSFVLIGPDDGVAMRSFEDVKAEVERAQEAQRQQEESSW